VFIDEAAFYLLPSVARTWAPKGHTPTLRYQATRDHLSAIAAITTKGDLILRTQETSFNSSDIVRFLIYLHAKLPGKLLIVWDSIPIHRSSTVKKHVKRTTGEIRLKYFPSYASELNPVEGIWHFMKNVALKNICTSDLTSLKYEIKLAERKLRRKRDFITSCLKEVGYFQ
jgi:transposase